MQEIEEDANKWKNIPCSWIGNTSIVIKFILYKAIYRFYAFPIKIALTLFCRKNAESCREPQMTTNSQSKAILRKDNQGGHVAVCNFKLYYKAIVIKITCNWEKTRQTNGKELKASK